MKAIRTAPLQKQNWRRTIHGFLLNYRATPHTTTNVAPATLICLVETLARNYRRSILRSIKTLLTNLSNIAINNKDNV